MRNNFRYVFSALTALALAAGIFAAPVSAAGEPENIAEEIIGYNLTASGSDTVQQWLDTGLARSIGSSEWYFFALKSYDASLDFSVYSKALADYCEEGDLPKAASSRQKTALALAACGIRSTDFMRSVLDDTVGKQGIMSYVFGLHLINNGLTSFVHTADSVVRELLERQLSDGGWAVSGRYGDPDVTAMTLQALAPYYPVSAAVKRAADKALEFLSAKQTDSGGYKSYGDENAESSAQVIAALSALGIDIFTDARFIKQGRTVLDGMLQFRLSDGGFSHKGGAADDMATQQAFLAVSALLAFQKGESSPLLFVSSVPVLDESAFSDLESEQKPSSTASENVPPQSSQSGAASSSPAASSGSAESESLAATAAEDAQDGAVPEDAEVTEKSEARNTQTGKGNGGKTVLIISAVAAAVVAGVLLWYFLKKRKRPERQPKL